MSFGQDIGSVKGKIHFFYFYLFCIQSIILLYVINTFLILAVYITQQNKLNCFNFAYIYKGK